MTGNGPLGRKPAGTFNFEPPPPGRALYLDPATSASASLSAARRSPTAAGSAAARVGPPAGLLLPARGRADRTCSSPATGTPAARRRARRRTTRSGSATGGRGRRLVLPRAAAAPADEGPDRLLLQADGPLVRGGRGDLRPPRDPYHRVDVLRTTGTSGSRSTASCWPRPTARRRCSRPTCRRAGTCRAEDVGATLGPTDTVTRCPYKGAASYYSVGCQTARSPRT